MPNKSDPHRTARVASRMHEILSAQLARLGDPRLQGVLIAGVEVNRDCTHATVNIAMTGDDDAQKGAERAVKLLRTMEGGFRKRIAPLLALRVVPELVFTVDRTRAERERMDALLAEVALELKEKKDT